jgi:protein SCO1/2
VKSCLWLLALTLASSLAFANEPGDLRPQVLDKVGVDQKLGAQLPMNARFRDENGNERELRTFFTGRPVILTFVYYECPMLCTMTLNQLNRSINGLTESAGESFDIITISFDSHETPDLAAAKKRNYLRSYRRASAADGWHFLTGSEESVKAVTEAAGFRFTYDEANKQFAHASVVMTVTPDGKLSRYFLGTDYPPTDVRTALQVAAAGKIGTPVEQVLFYCFKYDPATGKYGLIISRALKVLGGITVVGVAGLLTSLHFVRARRLRELQGQASGFDGSVRSHS